jgi:hypothetical protein
MLIDLGPARICVSLRTPTGYLLPDDMETVPHKNDKTNRQRSRACVASCIIPQTISVVSRDPGVSVCSADFSLYLEVISSAFYER